VALGDAALVLVVLRPCSCVVPPRALPVCGLRAARRAIPHNNSTAARPRRRLPSVSLHTRSTRLATSCIVVHGGARIDSDEEAAKLGSSVARLFAVARIRPAKRDPASPQRGSTRTPIQCMEADKQAEGEPRTTSELSAPLRAKVASIFA
jgi:hypothetical protein